MSKTQVFIEKARAVHGDRYDYSKTVYVRRANHVNITCRIHGDFLQTASSHLDGRGCRPCGMDDVSARVSFIPKALIVHRGLYDYSKVDYVRHCTPVIITCSKHGDFEQTPSGHLAGSGCPRCPRRYDQPTAVYLMQMGAQVKIGISINPEARLSIINRHNPEPARIVTTWTLEDFPAAYAMEQKLHQRLRDYHAGLSGFDGATEWFNTTPCHAEWVINKAVQYANEVCKL